MVSEGSLVRLSARLGRLDNDSGRTKAPSRVLATLRMPISLLLPNSSPTDRAPPPRSVSHPIR